MAGNTNKRQRLEEEKSTSIRRENLEGYTIYKKLQENELGAVYIVKSKQRDAVLKWFKSK